jgi:hypothetical protein
VLNRLHNENLGCARECDYVEEQKERKKRFHDRLPWSVSVSGLNGSTLGGDAEIEREPVDRRPIFYGSFYPPKIKLVKAGHQAQ